MNKKIFKYELKITEMQHIDLPIGAEILSIQQQDGIIVLWALVDITLNNKPIYFEIFSTGNNIYYDMGIDRKYLATCQMDNGLSWHIFERLN